MSNINFVSSLPVFQDRLPTTQNRSAKKGWFLTFPRSEDVTRVKFLAALMKQFALECACVVQEPHEDGEPHLHALIKLKAPLHKIHVLKPLQKLYPDASLRLHVKSVAPKDWKEQLMYIVAPEKDKEVDESPLYYNLKSPLDEVKPPGLEDYTVMASIFEDMSDTIQRHQGIEEIERGRLVAKKGNIMDLTYMDPTNYSG